jgi:glycosyltransferase involved in cell wall biosynthesis
MVRRQKFLTMQERKKIIFLSSQTIWTGVQGYIVDLATNLPVEKYDVLVIGSGDHQNSRFWSVLQQRGVKIMPILSLKFHPNLKLDFDAYKKIKKIFQNEKPDVVHLGDFKTSILGALAAHKLHVTKIIYTPHGWVFSERLDRFKKWWYLKLEKFFAQYKNTIICSSYQEQSDSVKLKIKEIEHLPVIYNGIKFVPLETSGNASEKYELYEILKKKYDLSIDFQLNTIVGLMSNFYPPKGVEYFIEMAKIISAKFASLKFVIIGDGPMRKKIERLIDQYDLKEKIFLAGFIEQGERFLRAFDFFILPSLQDGLPYAVLEAMANKKPIIATKVGALPEILSDKKSALLVEPGDAIALADALETLLKDPVLAQTIKNGAFDRFTDELTLKTMIEKTMVEYEK